MKLPIALFCLALGLIQGVRHGHAAETLNLREFLPYKRTSSTSLISVTGTGHEFRFFSPTRDNEFFWDYRKGTVQRRTNFHSMSLRIDANGLSVLGDNFYDPLFHGNMFSPPWLIAPATVTEGQVVVSPAFITPVGFGSQWTGAVTGTLTFGLLETNHTPAGKVAILPLTFRYDWRETGPGGRGTGTVAQTWWMTREIGVFRTEFTYSETSTNGVAAAGFDRFHLVSSTLLTSSAAVVFPDPNLEAAVRARLFKPAGILTAFDLSSLLDLPAESRSITNLTGLDYAYRLHTLRLASNQISDLSPLSGLTDLRTLDLSHNQAGSLQPLRGLTNLSALALTRNSLVDLSPLAGLIQLRSLIADENQIVNISTLTNLTRLETLILGANRIEDVRPLAGLSLLTRLEVEANRIADITPLATLTRLWNASVEENCLDVSPGADDRKIIEGWIRNGTEVEEEWVMQNSCSAADVVLRILRVGDNASLEWNSTSSVAYRVENSQDLAVWVNADALDIPGTGAVVTWPLPNISEPRRYYRLRALPKP